MQTIYIIKNRVNGIVCILFFTIFVTILQRYIVWTDVYVTTGYNFLWQVIYDVHLYLFISSLNNSFN